jgi:hypothetical protein
LRSWGVQRCFYLLEVWVAEWTGDSRKVSHYDTSHNDSKQC